MASKKNIGITSPPPLGDEVFRDLLDRPAVAREMFLPFGRARWMGPRYTLGRGERQGQMPTVSGVRIQEPDPNNVDIHREKGCQRDLVTLVRSVVELRKHPQLSNLVLGDSRDSLVGDDSGEIAGREYQDSYRNLKELFLILQKCSENSEYSEINSCIKGLYQIQTTLGLPIDAIDSALRWLESRLRSCTVSGKSIARTERVNPGNLLDSKKMLAVNNGTHVKQPLGVVCIDAEGKVLGKAKVICS